MSDKIDWRALMRVGLHDLRLRPAEFWALTPLEFLMMAGASGSAPMTRSGLLDLQARFPDKNERAEIGG